MLFSLKVDVSCDAKDTLEVPIRTKHRGALGIAVIVVTLLASLLGNVHSVSAHASSTTSNKVVSTSATKAVRTKTAYRKRRASTPVSPKKRVTSVPKRVTQALPHEELASSSSADIANRAKALVGSRYRWGGGSPQTGFDCTGLVHYVYGAKASQLPRSSAAMYYSVPKTASLRPGDIVFFGRGRATHAAVYIGGGKVVHASTPKSGVRVDKIDTLSRALGLMGVGRV